MYPKLNKQNKIQHLPDEIWKDIISFEGYYQISNLGRVKRLKNITIKRNQVTSWEEQVPDLIMKIHNDSKGYPQVRLTKPFTKVCRIHRLVAEAFLKPPSERLLDLCGNDILKVIVNHKDQDTSNPHYSNLEWCTSSYNNSYKSENKNTKKGSTAYNSVLTDKDVLEIVDYLINKTHSQTKLAELYSVKQITISNIWTGRSWNHLTGFEVTPRTYKKKMIEKSVSESCLNL